MTKERRLDVMVPALRGFKSLFCGVITVWAALSKYLMIYQFYFNALVLRKCIIWSVITSETAFASSIYPNSLRRRDSMYSSALKSRKLITHINRHNTLHGFTGVKLKRANLLLKKQTKKTFIISYFIKNDSVRNINVRGKKIELTLLKTKKLKGVSHSWHLETIKIVSIYCNIW